MGEAIGQSLSYAVGVAVSPVPIAALLLMLVSKRAKTNAPMFLLGWVLGLAVVGVVVLLVPGLTASQGEPSTLAGVVKGILGVLLLALGVWMWMRRPQAGEVVEAPGWMNRIDSFGGGAAFGIGVVLTAANPKNLLLTVGGVVTIAGSSLTTAQQYLALGVFLVVASLTVFVPVVVYLVLGDRAEQAMAETKDWLIQNNRTVMAVLVLVLSASLIGDSIEIIF